ncbi:MAG: hypothetical protein ACK57R_17645 [Dolichospermum sp.]
MRARCPHHKSFIIHTALTGVMSYIFSGQDARTTRVLSFISVVCEYRELL